MDSGEWGKDWFEDSSSERKPLLTSSGLHLRRPFDPESDEFRYCRVHIRKLAIGVCICECVALVLTLAVSSILYAQQSPPEPSIMVGASPNSTVMTVSFDDHATRTFAISLLSFLIGLPSTIIALYGIKTENLKYLAAHLAAETAAIVISATFFSMAVWGASKSRKNAHLWANEGNRQRRDAEYRTMTYHTEMAVLLSIITVAEAIGFLISLRCLTYLKTKRLVDEGRLVPYEIAELKRTFSDSYVF